MTDAPDAFPWQEFLFPEDSAVPDDSAVRPQPVVAVKRHAASQKRPEPLQKRTGQQTPTGLDLRNFLKRENIPKAVIAAMVLGAPRSKDPLPHRVHRNRPSIR